MKELSSELIQALAQFEEVVGEYAADKRMVDNFAGYDEILNNRRQRYIKKQNELLAAIEKEIESKLVVVEIHICIDSIHE